MKKIIFLLLFIVSGAFFSQNSDQKTIKEDIKSFYTSFGQKNYDKILDLTYPALFEKFDKNILKQAFKMAFEGNEDIKMELLDVNSDSDYIVSEIYNSKENEKQRYAFVSYPFQMKMAFVGKKFDEENKKMIISMMLVKGVNTEFLNDNTIKISKIGMAIAINDKVTNYIWKYINHDEENPIYVSIVPLEIIKNAKDYYLELQIKQKENAN